MSNLFVAPTTKTCRMQIWGYMQGRNEDCTFQENEKNDYMLPLIGQKNHVLDDQFSGKVYRSKVL